MPWFEKKSTPHVPNDMSVMELLHEAKISKNPVYAYACLERAEIMAPESLEVQLALLLLGRLHEREKYPAEYSLIKSYLLNGFEHPEKYTEDELSLQAQELFCDKRLQYCLSLADHKHAFLERYLKELSEEYMHIFVQGDSSHAPRVFGFSVKSQMHSYFAVPAADIIRNALSSPFLDEQQQRLVARSFYKAYQSQMNSDTKDLDKLLGAQICAALA